MKSLISRLIALKQNLTVGIVLTSVVILAATITVAAIGYAALEVVYQNKLRDTWAIMFLDLEQRAHRISEDLKQKEIELATKTADIILRSESASTYRSFKGAEQGLIKLKDLPTDAASMLAGKLIHAIKFNDKLYLMKSFSHSQNFMLEGTDYPAGKYIYLYSLEISAFMKDTGLKETATTFYISNRNGHLLYSNDVTVSEIDLIKRPLVQSFMSQPLTQGQLDIPTRDGGRLYGFYQEVPATNLVVFAERDRKDALSVVTNMAVSFITVVAVALAILALILQFPMQAIVRPLRDLVRMSRDVANGNFGSRPRHRGFGELETLTSAFINMAESLESRDQQIASLVESQKEKIRIDHELEIAKAIQNNLLSIASIPRTSGVDLAITYRPASEVAGDWYGCHYNEALGETIVVIADVTGHGVGAAMVTAMMSVIFDECIRTEESFNATAFVERLNYSLYKLGRGQASATMIIFKYKRKQQVIELINVSHPRPLFLTEASQTKAVGSQGVSTLLGLEPKIEIPVETQAFPRGSQILLYSDGLITRSQDHVFGKKQVSKIFSQSKSNAKDVCKKIESAWQEFNQGNADDDLCLIVVRAA